MNRRQKAVLRDFMVVMIITIVSVIAMIVFKDWVNCSEAMRAMEHLGQVVSKYRSEHGVVPPELYINAMRQNLQGSVRLGKLRYRAQWIDFDAAGDELLAYVERDRGFLGIAGGVIVLRLDGRVEWMDKADFERLLGQGGDLRGH